MVTLNDLYEQYPNDDQMQVQNVIVLKKMFLLLAQKNRRDKPFSRP